MKHDVFGTEVETFLITFTDKTYIAIGAYLDNYNDPELVVKRVADICEYGDGFFERKFRFDTNGNMTTDNWIKMLVNFGLWSIDEDKLRETKERYQNDEREKLHAKYLELKEMFEPDESRDEK